jgi:hypothetical protein
MTTRPHDLSDLYLSPIALELDRRLAEFSSLSHEEIELRIILETDRVPRDPAGRAEIAIGALSHLIELHDWHLAWDPRGLRLTHDSHTLVLGVPESLRSYLAQ